MGVSPAREHRVFGGARHVADLGHKDGGEDAPDAVDGVNGVIAGVVAARG